jgi:L-amino acid N-acyltransferase YncA
VKLRRPTRDELDQICAWASDRAMLGPHQRPYAWQPPLAPGLAVWLIIVKGNTVGFAYADRKSLGVVEIGVTLLPDRRGRGYGRAAHEALLSEIQGGADRYVQALAASTNIGEIRILRRLGFAPVDRLAVSGEDGKTDTNLLIFRLARTARPDEQCLVAFVTGAPGAGKSTICDLIKPMLARRYPQVAVRFIWGDMLSHLSFPWRADADQLALKYDAMRQLLDRLIRPSTITIVDDLFRRRDDVDDLRRFVVLRQSRPLFIRLDVAPQVALLRNRTRYEREILQDDKVLELIELVRAAVPPESADLICVENDGGPFETATTIVGLLGQFLVPA